MRCAASGMVSNMKPGMRSTKCREGVGKLTLNGGVRADMGICPTARAIQEYKQLTVVLNECRILLDRNDTGRYRSYTTGPPIAGFCAMTLPPKLHSLLCIHGISSHFPSGLSLLQPTIKQATNTIPPPPPQAPRAQKEPQQ